MLMKFKDPYVTSLDFLISAINKGSIHKTENVLEWMQKMNDIVESNIVVTPLKNLKGWSLNNGNLNHESGKFFSIEGIRINTNYGLIAEWDQPIINQPEIGFLGIISKKFNGILHFLMQAKIEPGNINIVQLSPTLQATRSNYNRVHKGIAPLYLDFFNNNRNVTVLIDQLQSEQGARFLHKRNRNIIVEIDENEVIDVNENFIWLTIGQIKELMSQPNIVNMDTRTVISCIHYGNYSEESLKLLFLSNIFNAKSEFIQSILSTENHLNKLTHIIQWITSLKFKYELTIERISIDKIRQWNYDGNIIHHEKNKYFSVIGVDVNIRNREVVSWCQPMIQSAQEGIIGFLVKKINGIYHFLVQAKLEAGNFDIIELAPTVQCLTGNYRNGQNEYSIPYLEFFIDPIQNNIWYSCFQSEEGGRFYQEQNLNMIIEVKDDFPTTVDENYCWMTLNQILSFLTYNNYLNISARSLISAIRFY